MTTVSAALLLRMSGMRLRIRKKLAKVADGVDLSDYTEGDIIELESSHAAVLIAEGWAEPAPEATPSRPRRLPPEEDSAVSDPNDPHC
jgi:hypothetical protein